MKKVQIKEKNDFVRDITTNAVINSNVSAYKQAIESRKKRLSTIDRIENLEKNIKDVNETLKKILNKLN